MVALPVPLIAFTVTELVDVFVTAMTLVLLEVAVMAPLPALPLIEIVPVVLYVTAPEMFAERLSAACATDTVQVADAAL